MAAAASAGGGNINQQADANSEKAVDGLTPASSSATSNLTNMSYDNLLFLKCENILNKCFLPNFLCNVEAIISFRIKL